ncbi:MAG: sugar ABC transporter permease, partial [Caldilineaceae bacterium]|nr:sugar ABC transporter permease [Caldilineaceae bacterium]
MSTNEENLRPPMMVRIRPWLIAMPALIVLIGILYPFLTAIYYSLTAYTLNRPGSLDQFVGLRNYWRMFTD